MNREREQIRIPETLARLRRRRRHGERALVVAGRFVLHGDRHQQIAALHTILLLTIDEALSAAEPPCRVTMSPRTARLTPRRRRSAPTKRLAVVYMRVMSTFENARKSPRGRPERRGRQQLEVVGPERTASSARTRAVRASSTPGARRPHALARGGDRCARLAAGPDPRFTHSGNATPGLSARTPPSLEPPPQPQSAG
jgi:hypothetical protein